MRTNLGTGLIIHHTKLFQKKNIRTEKIVQLGILHC